MSELRRIRRRRPLFGRAAVGLAVIASTVAVPASAPAAPPAAAPACATQAATESLAQSTALRCGVRVAVTPLRSEYAEVYAEPNGTLRFESGVLPQRVRRGDGTWAEVDLSLAVAPDGSWRPRASVADVRFSAGGSAPMATLVRDGRTLTFSWPGQLPVPTVTADSATYAEVWPGVDLVLRATHTGFVHVLVVKTPQAVTPAVRALTIGVGGQMTLQSLPDGSMRALDGASVLASAQPAVMWTSDAAGQAQGLRVPPGSVASSAGGPGDRARTAPVRTELSADGRQLVLRADPALLADSSAYPLYIDPAWSVAKAKWAYATSNGSNNTDYSVARVGLNPDSGVRYRSFFEFPTTSAGVSLKGKHIESAYVQMKLDHSWSCGDTWAHLYLTPVINATMRASWSTMKLSKWLSSAAGHANEAGGCGVVQPDMIMNFDGGTVTSQVQAAANGNWNSITVGFCACNGEGEWEDAQDRWKKFFPGEARLIVDYDAKPTAPTDLQVAGVACAAPANAISVGTLTPTLSAVYPDADTGQTLRGAFEWLEVPPGTPVTDTSPARKTPPPVAPAAARTRGTTVALSGLVKGKKYAFRVRTTDPAPYNVTSPWSAYCYFEVDNTDPPVSASVVTAPAGPGLPGTFRIESTATDVVKFRYGWNGAVTEVAASAGSPKYATVVLNPQKYGQNTLYVAAVDATGNVGNGSRDIMVGRPTPPVARWGLSTYPGVDAAQALADQQSALLGNTPLTATDLGWRDDIHLVDGQSAHFNGSSTVLRATGPVIDTAGSFSVAAWARLEPQPGCTNMTIAASDDPDSAFAAFDLGFSCWTGKWWFRLADREVGEPVYAFAASPNPAMSQTWTHLAGVWDEPQQQLRLYVNGALVSEVTPAADWLTRRGSGFTAGGALQVGRERGYGSYGGHLYGEIADVQVFNRALVDEDLTGEPDSTSAAGVNHEPGIIAAVEVGRWNFNTATPCYLQNLANTCEAADGAAWSRWMSLQRGTGLTNGRDGSAAIHLDGCYFAEENPPPCEPTTEYGISAYKLGVDTSDPLQPKTQWWNTPVLNTHGSYAISAWVLPTDVTTSRTVLSHVGWQESSLVLSWDPSSGGRWKFTVTRDDGPPAAQASVYTAAIADPVNTWSHLVVVYDSGTREIRLYVNGKRAAAATLPWTPMGSIGQLYLGRHLRTGAFGGSWAGGIDDVVAYQGPLNDAAVALLHDQQSIEG